MKKMWVALLCLLILALPLGALAEGLEIEYDEVAAVMAPEAPEAEDEILSDALETEVAEAGEFLLGEEQLEEVDYADFVSAEEQGVMASADDFEIINGVLVEYRGNGGAVTIPDGVTIIGEDAFKECEGLGSVKIPASVSQIGKGAFYRCENLSKVQIMGNAISIGSGAFDECYRLNSINLPVGLTSIEDYTFGCCESLQSITLPDGLTYIGRRAFGECSSLTSIRIPDSVTDMASGYLDGSFAGCSKLKSATLSKGMTYVPEDIFGGCESLESITIPDGVTEIRWSAFDGCTSLTKVSLPDSLKYIRGEAFRDCTALSSISIPDGVIEIGDNEWEDGSVFAGCTSLVSVKLPKNLLKITGRMFEGCSSLTDVTIPGNVNKICDSAFASCESLKTIAIPSSVSVIAGSAFSNCSNLETVTLSEGLAKIEEHAFYECKNLKNLVLPETVGELEDRCFEKCYGLTNVTVKSDSIVIADWAFRDVPKETTFHTICDSAATKWAQERNYNVDKSAHAVVIDEAVPATCTATGLTEGSHCSVCSTVLKAQETVQKTAHTPVTDEAVAPTCTATGLTEGSHCSVCGEVLKAQETVQATGHTPVTDAAVAPTATTPGKTEGSHCSTCGVVLVAQENIFATGAIQVTGTDATYDGEAHGIKVSVSAPKNATVRYGVKKGSCNKKSSPTYTGAGTYTLYYKVEAENYVTVENSVKLTIAPKTVGLKWTKTTLTYNGKSRKPTATATGLVGNDKCTVTVTGAKKDVGKYTATASKLSNANYALPKKNTGAFAIKPKIIGLKWTKTSLTYNGKAQKPKATATGLIKGDKCTVTVTGTRKAAGKGTAKATKLSNANYKLPETVTKAFTVAKKTVGLKWTKTTLTYNGKSQKPTLTLTGLIKGDKCTATVTGARKSAGKGTAKVTKLSNKNYKLPKTVTQAFTINKKTVGLEWTNLEFDYDGKSHKPTATATGLIEGDTCTVTVTGARKSAGTGTAKASRLSNANYKLPKDIAMEFDIVE